MTVRPLWVFATVALFLLASIPTPVARASDQGDALINPFNMVLGYRFSVTKDQVIHWIASYYVRFCVVFQGGNCVQYESHQEWRVSSSWVQRRYHGWLDFGASGLTHANVAVWLGNVHTAFPSNFEQQAPGGLRYYYYCPPDGSTDGSNRVGFATGDGIPNIGPDWITARYDIPRLTASDVLRTGTLAQDQVSPVSPSQQLKMGDATQWNWVVSCIAARHNLGLSGYEVRHIVWSRSHKVNCCWSVQSFSDYTELTRDF